MSSSRGQHPSSSTRHFHRRVVEPEGRMSTWPKCQWQLLRAAAVAFFCMSGAIECLSMHFALAASKCHLLCFMEFGPSGSWSQPAEQEQQQGCLGKNKVSETWGQLARRHRALRLGFFLLCVCTQVRLPAHVEEPRLLAARPPHHREGSCQKSFPAGYH